MANGYDYRKYAVLYVDDEEKSLKYFRMALGRDFDVMTASSAAEAMEILEREGDRIGVLVTDQRMPEETGTDLLGRVRRQRPGIVRVLTTAYSDLDSAIEAVNSGGVFRYVTKPWDIRDLRGVLLRAMEFFLIQRERDLLLREKLSVLQRMLVADRVRSLAVLAAGLAHHIRNSMSALVAFLDMAQIRAAEDALDSPMAQPRMWETIRSLARQESEKILSMVQQVAETTVVPSPMFTATVYLDDVVRGAAEIADLAPGEGALDLDLAPDLGPLKADPVLLKRLFGLVLARMARMGGPGRRIRVEAAEAAAVWGTPGVRVSITGDGPPWTDEVVASFFTAFTPEKADPQSLGLDLLAAFFIAYHHGGDIVVHKAPPNGPGFELLLPFDPEASERPSLEQDCMEKLFVRLAPWEEEMF